MHAFAAVMTGKGTGAIATIQIIGESAKGIVENIFRPVVELQVGKIYVGKIGDSGKTIDQVTIGCIDAGTLAINCHGNPLIVEQICQLLRREGVELLTAEEMIAKTSTDDNAIAVEAKLMLPKVKTNEGTQIILNQIDSGLSAIAKKWLKSTLEEINVEARKIIEASEAARYIIFGCKVVLAGPPNTGKSTLLNHLSGREKAIVTNIRGTTRDWVSAECKIGTMAVELIDTAGLDETIANDIDKAAQQGAIDIINQADLILLVLDNSESTEQLTSGLIDRLSGKKVLTVLNKSDIAVRFGDKTGGVSVFAGATPDKNPSLQNKIKISAMTGAGIDKLAEKVCEIMGVKNFDMSQAVCFTSRQEGLLKRIAEVKSKEAGKPLITELLSGPLNVL